MPGGFLAVSANNDENGIVWASTPYNDDAVHRSVEGVLYAFDAETLKLLWTDKTNAARDDVGYFAKYVPPVVANGKMYVPNFGTASTNDGSGNLLCYGLLLPQLTVAVANGTMTAGAAVPTLTGTVTGLVNGDTVGTTILVTYSTTATSSSPAGTYPITATVSGSSAANYQVTVNAGTLTVTAAQLPTLTVSASNATRVYNTANPAFTGTVTGAQNGDTFTETFSTTATMTSAVGSYAIVPTASGTDLNNYTLNTVNGTLTITQATQTITFPGIASRAYGSAPFAVTATSSAGTNYPVTITVVSGPATIAGGMVTLTGAGTVVLQASQAGDANYSAATASQSFAVTAATLTATASNATRSFNTANPTFTGYGYRRGRGRHLYGKLYDNGHSHQQRGQLSHCADRCRGTFGELHGHRGERHTYCDRCSHHDHVERAGDRVGRLECPVDCNRGVYGRYAGGRGDVL